MAMRLRALAASTAFVMMPASAWAQAATPSADNPSELVPRVTQGCITASGSDVGAGRSATCGEHGTPPAPAVVQAGGAPVDASVNAAGVPIAGYSLLQTIDANPKRANVECQNQSTSLAQLVLDDGLGTAAATSTVMLLAAQVTGGQGGTWSDPTFKQRVRIYGPVSTQRVMCRQD